MKRSLKGKLILSYLAVALITVLVVSVLIWLTSDQSMMNMVVQQEVTSLSEAVQTYYTANGTLDGFYDDYLQKNMMFGGDQPPSNPPNTTNQNSSSNPIPSSPDMRSKHPFRGVQGLVDASYRSLIPSKEYAVGDTVPQLGMKNATEVKVDGKTVAWILPDTSFEFNLSNEEQDFMRRTTMAIGVAALTGVVIAMVMGILLAGGILKPIRRLTQASHALAHGQLKQQVPVTSQDELGQLTTTFNQMSADLAAADQQRKRLTADVTHDLSTPLQIISGYIEMVEEGGIELTPERIEIIKTEIGHLRRLVGDLSTLTQVDASELDIQLQPVQPDYLMERIYRGYQPIAARQGVEITLDMPQYIPAILLDEGRMLQVLKNLVENALRYTPKGGMIKLGIVVSEQVQLSVADTGSGIDADDLPYVFDRFYRADKSRSGNSGKMGLGLAICKALVTAQGGAISAFSDGRGKGTEMIITFNMNKSKTE